MNDKTLAGERSATDTVEYARVTPLDSLAVLSQREVERLCGARSPALNELLRRCTLAVLSSGLEVDDARGLLERFRNYAIELMQEDRGLCLELHHAPGGAFVDGRMIRGTREHLFSVLRDIVYMSREIEFSRQFDWDSPAGITDAVFRILRHAEVLPVDGTRGLAVCWGGHSIGRVEYDYTKELGYRLGLRGLDVCTGCGPGAMKGPMKGAAIAHAKQRIANGRYIGVTEPGIIAAEAPNPIVNKLVIMPDMEKRLEAFVRLAHAIVVFPGGVGTAEELLYLLGILAEPGNPDHAPALVLTGPRESAAYFEALDAFIRKALGEEAAARYTIIIDQPDQAASLIAMAVDAGLERRDANDDASYFNWGLKIEPRYQMPFEPSHAAMAALKISRDLPPPELAANLRRLFSGIVAGNVKESGVAAVEAFGPFQIDGDSDIMRALDELLRQFVAQERMQLPGRVYRPCYEIAV